jgi:hypothetical protein
MRGDAEFPRHPTADNVARSTKPHAGPRSTKPTFSFTSPLSLCPLPSHKELISFLQKKLFPKKLLVPFPHPTFPLSKHRPTLLTLPTILSATPELKLTPDVRQPHFSPHFWLPFPWGITPLKSILTRSLTVCSKVCFPSLLVKSCFLVPCDTSIDPFFRIDGGILSFRASTYHKVTSPCCVMWLLVTDLKECRKGRVSRLFCIPFSSPHHCGH